MGGPMLREEPGEGEQPQRAAVQAAENILRSVPQKTAVPLPVENAEKLLRDLITLANQIDAMFGRSVAGETADITRKIGRMRAQLDVIGAEQVAGVNERYSSPAQRIALELSRVETGLGSRELSESRAAFNRASAGVEMLSETIAAARGLFSAGAPEELLNATDRALELYNAGQDTRARLLLKAASTFIANRDFFTSAAGSEGRTRLMEFVHAISNEALVVDESRAEKTLETFRQALSYPREQRADDRDSVANGAQLLGAATAVKLADTLDAWFAKGDVEGAKTLAGMTRTYIALAQAGKDEAGLETAKAALVRYADTGDQAASNQFREAAMGLAVTSDLMKLRSSIASWRQGPYRNVAREALENTDMMLQEKKYGEAATMLAFTSMYADSVRVLGLEKASQPQRQDEPLASGFGAMAKALGALGRNQPAVDGMDAAALFASGHDTAIHMGLKRNHAELVQKFEGKAPWADGLEPGLIPLGARRSDGTYPGSLEIGKLREYEKKSGDAALKGQALDQLLAACGRAAQNGDAEAYHRSMEALMNRFSLVSSRYFAGQMADGAEQMAKGLDSIKKAYNEGATSATSSRLDRLGQGMLEFSAELRSGAKLDAEIPRVRYNALRDAFSREQALATMANQAAQNARYESMAKGITGSMAGVSLRGSTVHFINAEKALLKGGDAKTKDEYAAAIANATAEYEAAMKGRQAALAVFSAAGREKKARTDIGPLFDGWRKLQMEILDGVLAGTDTKKLQERAGLVEVSVFGLPEKERGLFDFSVMVFGLPEKERGFVDFSVMQKNVREFALAGKTAEAEAEWGRMQKTLEKQKLWTNVAKTVAGLATIPVPMVSGAIFASMVANQAIDEAAEAGRVSGMTWAMLGITIATMGIGGVAGELRTAAQLAKAAGRARAATAYGRAAVGVTTAGIGAGVGMGVMTVPATIRAFEEGRYGEATFNVAMVLFPFAHMGGTYVRGRITAARARAAEDFGKGLEGLVQGTKPMPPEVVPARIGAPEEAQGGARTSAPATVRGTPAAGEVVGEAAPVARPRPVARRTEQQVYDDYMRQDGGGILPMDLTTREWAYVQARTAGATHDEALLLLAGKARGPTAAERMRQLREASERTRNMGEIDIPHDLRENFDAAIAEIGGGRTWMVGGETIAGEIASTGRMLRSIERQVIALVEGGQDVDIVVVSGDKARLNQINDLMGPGYGDRALAAYRELFERSVYEVTGDKGMAFMIQPNPTGDEAIGILIVKGGRGKEVRTKLAAAIETQTTKVFGEYANPAHKMSLAAVRNMARNELDLVAEVVDVGEPVFVRRGTGGKATATNADGSDAMVTHDVPTASGTEAMTEFMPKLVRTAEEQGSASHAPEMRRKLNCGTDTEIRTASNIRDVAEGEIVSGTPFEIRLEITDPAILADARALLPKTRKALEETLTNRFGIRGCNTFLGHYGTNDVFNLVEKAMGEYAVEHNRTFIRLGKSPSKKYNDMGGATPEEMKALNQYLNSRLQQAGMKFRVSDHGYVEKPLENVSVADALASISNGRLKVNWKAPAYGDANALISAMAIGNDATLLKLLGGDYRAMQGLVEFVRKNPAVRNVEDLFIALQDPTMGGSNGPKMHETFRAFISGKSMEFRARLATLAPPVARLKTLAPPIKAEEMVLDLAAGAEGEVLQPAGAGRGGGTQGREIPLEHVQGGKSLEEMIGTRPRGPEFEAALNTLVHEKEKAVARVLDAILAGEVKKENVPPEYSRVAESIAMEGRGKAGHGAKEAERAFIVISSVPDVMTARGVAALEHAMAARGMEGELREEAEVLFRSLNNLHVKSEDIKQNAEQDCLAVLERTQRGEPEADAILEVVAARQAAYVEASEALEAAMGTEGLRRMDAELARTLLRWLYDRKIGAADQHLLTERVLAELGQRLNEGRGDAEALISTAREIAKQAKAALPAGFDESIAPLAFLEIRLPALSGTAAPWKMVPATERHAYARQVWEVYDASYGKANRQYDNADELLQRLPMWMVASEKGGKVVGFVAFSSTKRGTRLAVGGARPESWFGRAAVHSVYAAFGRLDGTYGLVSGRPAEIALGSNTPVVQFGEAKTLLGKEPRAKFARAQQDMSKIRQMNGFDESKVVTDAAARTGSAPGKLEFGDLVEQAVLNRDIPDTPEARGNCFATVQSINGRPTVVIKLMVGKPVNEGG